MPVQIDDQTIGQVKVVGGAIGSLIAVASAPIVFVYRFANKLRSDVDKHTDQLTSLEVSVEKGNHMREQIMDKVDTLTNVITALDVKVDLLISNKIK